MEKRELSIQYSNTCESCLPKKLRSALTGMTGSEKFAAQSGSLIGRLESRLMGA